jgi:hypothetical protein
MKNEKKEDKIIYEEPPMIWDAGLFQFVPDFSKIEKKKEDKGDMNGRK